MSNEANERAPSDSWYTFHMAVADKKQEEVKAILDRGMDVNTKGIFGRTALHVPTTAAIARELIRRGGDVNARDENGDTPLHLARRKDVIELLMKEGANPRAENNKGRIPLDHAIYSKHEVIRSLLPMADKRDLVNHLDKPFVAVEQEHAPARRRVL